MMNTNTRLDNRQDVVFLVMYDITDDSTRNAVIELLSQNGCIRIKKSIFIGNLPFSRLLKIENELKCIQQAYENDDSYIIVPLRKESVNAMKIIGKKIDLDIILRRKNLLFL